MEIGVITIIIKKIIWIDLAMIARETIMIISITENHAYQDNWFDCHNGDCYNTIIMALK